MNEDPKLIMKRFEEAALSSILEASSDWQKYHNGRLKEFNRIIKSISEQIKADKKFELSIEDAWKILELNFIELLTWVESLSYSDKDQSQREFVMHWLEKFQLLLNEFPQEIEIPVTEEFWKPVSTDSLPDRIWKFNKRLKRRSVKINLKIKNFFRKLARKLPKELPVHTRKFDLYHFLTDHVERPVVEYILKEWQIFLRSASLQFARLQSDVERLKEKGITLEKLKSYTDEEKKELRIPVTIFDEILEELRISEIDSTLLKSEAQSRFSQNFENVLTRFYSNWELAGTFLHPVKTFEKNGFNKQWAFLEKSFKKIREAWDLHFRGIREEWQNSLELSILQLKLSQIYKSTIRRLYDQIERKMQPSIKEVIDLLSKSAEKLRAPKSAKALKQAITTENRDLIKELRYVKLPHVLDMIVQTQIIQILENYSSEFDKARGILSKEHVIFVYRDDENTPPKSKIDDIPLKELVDTEILSRFSDKYNKFIDTIRENLESISRTISEIDQVVEFNLEAGLNLITQDDSESNFSEAQKVVLGGFERAEKLFNDLLSQSVSIAEECNLQLFERSLEFEHEIQNLADNEKIFDLKLRFARAKTEERIREYRHKAITFVKSILPVIFVFVTGNFKKIWGGYSKFRKITGLVKPETVIEDQLSVFLSDTQTQVSKLPYVYQRLFRFEPLDDERFYAGRNSEMEMIENEFNDWQNGQYASTVLIGERGSGRTTLMKFAEKKYFQNHGMILLDILDKSYTNQDLLVLLKNAFKTENIADLDEFEEWILNSKEKHICIVENIQNLFIRVVDGFESIERFLLLVSRTHGKIFWLLSCTLYSWNYLDKVISISRFFNKEIFLGALPMSEMQSIILKRHRVSGYNLEFEDNESIRASRKFKKLTTDKDRQNFLKILFFDQLNDLSSGNVTVAMLYWLRSIKEILSDKIILTADINVDYSFLYGFPAEDLFTLGAIFQHETLSPKIHALIFHQNSQHSLLQLTRMENLGLIIKKERGYQIHPFLYRPLMRILKAKNIIQ